METFVAVHGGAGYHSFTAEKELKQALRLACNNALLVASSAGSSLDVTEAAITVLEDAPNLNAGFGSNLTFEGNVECDAAIMDGNNHWGSVGAVSGVKNPIRVARAILEYSQVPDPLGRIPPLTLVSSGARSFASKHLHTSSGLVGEGALISDRARDRWVQWKDRLSSASTEEGTNLPPPPDSESLHDSQDTVGAVASCSGNMSAGVSSGGLLLKMEGRCGEAAMFGAGCWAQNKNIRPQVQIGMACSVSGTGEYITRSGLAKALGKSFEAFSPSDGSEYMDPHTIMQQVLVDEFWKPSQDLGEPNPSAGILLMTYEDGDDNTPIVRVWCGFTTPTFLVAYASTRNPIPKTLILRRPKDMVGAHADKKAPIYMTAFSL
ncbi:nucleophile aminohydrolase [Rhodocollybia butyracea]|uniref:Nucleophile aminohydrolase n=1 Tax=Rhodocollybia butyracea TaxID=206335 RepID=A0A9P5Q5H3_9AGAR|nr:nucleophile aminohydrolase [Rhodocollybia butyracea]